MTPRAKHPVAVFPAALQALLALAEVSEKSTVPQRTLELVRLRASQINGCSFCAAMHGRDLKKLGETDDRLFTVAAWREAPWFTDAERVALALTEALTRVADRADPISDELWADAAHFYDEEALSVLLLEIGQINLWNRLNVATRQVAGTWP